MHTRTCATLPTLTLHGRRGACGGADRGVGGNWLWSPYMLLRPLLSGAPTSGTHVLGSVPPVSASASAPSGRASAEPLPGLWVRMHAERTTSPEDETPPATLLGASLNALSDSVKSINVRNVFGSREGLAIGAHASTSNVAEKAGATSRPPPAAMASPVASLGSWMVRLQPPLVLQVRCADAFLAQCRNAHAGWGRGLQGGGLARACARVRSRTACPCSYRCKCSARTSAYSRPWTLTLVKSSPCSRTPTTVRAASRSAWPLPWACAARTQAAHATDARAGAEPSRDQRAINWCATCCRWGTRAAIRCRCRTQRIPPTGSSSCVKRAPKTRWRWSFGTAARRAPTVCGRLALALTLVPVPRRGGAWHARHAQHERGQQLPRSDAPASARAVPDCEQDGPAGGGQAGGRAHAASARHVRHGALGQAGPGRVLCGAERELAHG